jgi:predicted DNA-binding transcriptional regulator YafY
MPPLLLDDEEAVAVAVGLRTAAGGAIAGIEEAALRALAKLEQVLPSRLRARVGGLRSVITPVPLVRGNHAGAWRVAGARRQRRRRGRFVGPGAVLARWW